MRGESRRVITLHGVRDRLGRWQPYALDVPLALLVCALELAELTRPTSAGSPVRPGDAVGVLLVCLVTLPLAARRIWPRAVLAVVVVAAAAICVGGYRQSTFALALMPMLYTVAVRYRARDAIPLLGGVVALLVVGFLSSREPVTLADVVQAVLAAGLAWWIGATLRVRAAYADAMAERAALLQRLHDEVTVNAVARERLRIARELHDVVAHSMSVVAVQSGVARHLADGDPQRSVQALDAIVASSRSALDELRRLLDVLRQDGSRGELDPSPTLADLGTLVGSVRAAGLSVDLCVPEPLPDVPPAIGLTVYRIVQEALTNTVKHAGPAASARVAIATQAADGDAAQRLVVSVEDHASPGVREDLGSAGVGLLGMRERVGLFGGSLTTGPTGNGFAVRAVLPLEVR